MKSVGLISLILFCNFAFSQVADTTHLKSFELIATKATSNTGAVKINMPLSNGGTLADVLNQYSALFVKSYCPGNLATTSMRGMGAQHTAVLWNGINLQSCMNSNIDLNLLPVFFFENASIETGANASSAANGSIAGAIYLNNDMVKLNRTYGDFQLGSFSNKSMAIGNTVALKKWIINTKFVLRQAENDFKYVNYFQANKPIERLQNSKFGQSGFMQEFKYLINSKHQLYANYWYLETKRQLPNAMGITSNYNERQDDYSHKFILQHSASLSTKVDWSNKFSLINETINYFNDLLSPAYNHANNYISESSLKWKINALFEMSSSVNYTYQQAFTDGFRAGKNRHLISVYTGFNYLSKTKRLKLSFGNRQLMSNGVLTPSSPDLGAEFKLHPKLNWKSNLAAGYRIPSFNDLFWQGGGNDQLQPEISKKAETSLEFKHNEFSLVATSFYHIVNDWILWTPDPQTSIWKANNAKEVTSKGLELASEYKLKLSKFHFVKLTGRYQFVKSVNTKVYQADSSSYLKQLFYTPLHTGFIQLNYQYKLFNFNLGSVFTGKVFTTADNSIDNELKSYTIFNSSINYTFKVKQHRTSIGLNVNNLGNATYQVMQNRPMPLRNYQLSIKFNINHE